VKPASNFLGADNAWALGACAALFRRPTLMNGDVEGGKLSDVTAGIKLVPESQYESRDELLLR
jgi:hypothetical protein